MPTIKITKSSQEIVKDKRTKSCTDFYLPRLQTPTKTKGKD